MFPAQIVRSEFCPDKNLLLERHAFNLGLEKFMDHHNGSCTAPSF